MLIILLTLYYAILFRSTRVGIVTLDWVSEGESEREREGQRAEKSKAYYT